MTPHPPKKGENIGVLSSSNLFIKKNWQRFYIMKVNNDITKNEKNYGAIKWVGLIRIYGRLSVASHLGSSL